MSALSDIYIKKETLKILLDTVEKKGEKGVSITVSINDDTNEYGQNVSSFVSQTKEQREAKMNKFFTGNGKVFWTNGTIKVAEKKEQATSTQSAQSPAAEEGDDLPF